MFLGTTLVSCRQKDRRARRVESKGDTPYPAADTDPQLLHVRMDRPLQYVDIGATKIRAFPLQHQQAGEDLVLYLVMKSLKLAIKILVE